MMNNQLSHRKNDASPSKRSNPASNEAPIPASSDGGGTTNVTNAVIKGRRMCRFRIEFMILLAVMAIFSYAYGIKASSFIIPEKGDDAAVTLDDKPTTPKKIKLDRRNPWKRRMHLSNASGSFPQGEMPSCIFSYNGGWGNNVFLTLWEYMLLVKETTNMTTTQTTNTTTAIIRATNEDAQNDHNITQQQSSPSLPCVDGFYKHIFGALFKNLQTCPETQPLSKCLYALAGDGWGEIKRDVKHELKVAPFNELLLQLNKTVVKDVLSRGCPALLDFNNNFEQEDQQQQQPKLYCGAHVRFGDVFFRNTSILGHRVSIENRICTAQKLKKEDPNATISDEECFEFVATKVREEACPNTSMPIFLAADHLPFVDYFKQGKGQDYPTVLTCSSDDVAAVQHTHDLGMNAAILTDPQITRMMSDWLGLALANSGTLPVFVSTFRETAAFSFYLD